MGAAMTSCLGGGQRRTSWIPSTLTVGHVVWSVLLVWQGLSEGLHTMDGQKASSSFPFKKISPVELAQLPTPFL